MVGKNLYGLIIGGVSLLSGGSYGIIAYLSNSSNSDEFKEQDSSKNNLFNNREKINELPDTIAEIIIKSKENLGKRWVCKELFRENYQEQEIKENWICEKWVSEKLKENKDTEDWLFWAEINNDDEDIKKVLERYEMQNFSSSLKIGETLNKEAVTCSKEESKFENTKIIITCTKEER